MMARLSASPLISGGIWHRILSEGENCKTIEFASDCEKKTRVERQVVGASLPIEGCYENGCNKVVRILLIRRPGCCFPKSDVFSPSVQPTIPMPVPTHSVDIRPVVIESLIHAFYQPHEGS